MSIKPFQRVKKGDTVIEVMFAIAVFALVAILSIAMMNSGIATGERSLELVTARNELNAQAEALRFIHSSYISELTLPKCGSLTAAQQDAGEKCQQFADLWTEIKNHAVPAYDIPTPINSCNEVYADGNRMLQNNHAFIINARLLGRYAATSNEQDRVSEIYIPATAIARYVGSEPVYVFQPASLGSRLIYTDNRNREEGNNSSVQQGPLPSSYTKLARAEGIWVVAVEDPSTEKRFYDFYIQTCWYGSGNKVPTTLDTIIRLNNPEGLL